MRDKVLSSQCMEETPVDSQNLPDSGKNFTVTDLISFLPADSQCAFHGDGDKHGPVVNVCFDCWKTMCATCSKAHTRHVEGHNVKLLSEIIPAENQAHKISQPVYCEAHFNKEVGFYCETCQRFVCNVCAGIKRKSHICLELTDADNKFAAQINAALQPLLEMKHGFDCKLNNISIAIDKLSKSKDILHKAINDVLNDCEHCIKTALKKILEQIGECRRTAKLTVNTSYSEQINQLKTSLVNKETTARNIGQLVTSTKQCLAAPSTVFDRATFVKTLPDIQKQTQAKTEVTTYLQPDISKWTNDVGSWLHNIIAHVTTATTSIPQLTDNTLFTRKVSAEGHVTSAKRTRDFTVEHVIGGKYDVSVLSVSSDGWLLVGQFMDSQLHVYSADGCHVTSVDLPNGDTLHDALWTPRGNIIFSAHNSNRVVTITRQGHIIQQTNHFVPNWLSVSTDDVIHLADARSGVYQSTDDGVTWSLVFKPAGDWRCAHAIQVSTDSNTDVFWTVDYLTSASGRLYRLRVCTVDKRQANSNVTWRDVTLPRHVAVDLQYANLAYDGHTNMFVTDCVNKAVHVWSVSGQYERQLLLSQLTHQPQRVAIDSQHGHVMYVGQTKGAVSVCELTYDSLKI